MLAEFNDEVVHHPGKQHQNADALSCKMCKQCGTQVGGEEITLEAQLNGCHPHRAFCPYGLIGKLRKNKLRGVI